MLWLGRSEVHVSWEPESSLPQSVVREFETGQKMQTVTNTADSYGLVSCTLVPLASSVGSPITKKARTEEQRVIIDENTG